jgi:hypothetical protein
LKILIKNLLSPDTKPANQFGSFMVWSTTIGLDTGLIFEKFVANLSDKPQFIDALIATILCKPSIVKCSLRTIKSTTFLNKIKSAFF